MLQKYKKVVVESEKTFLSSHRKETHSLPISTAESSAPSTTIPLKLEETTEAEVDAVSCLWVPWTIFFVQPFLWRHVSVTVGSSGSPGQPEPRVRCWEALQEEHQTTFKA